MDTTSNLQTQDSFTFSFVGQNEINAGILGATLSNITYVLNAAVKDDPGQPEFELKVKTFKDGSFSILFTAVVALAAQLSSICTIQEASSMFSLLKGMLDIKQFLKGSRAKNIVTDIGKGHISIESPDGSNLIVPLGSKVAFIPDVDRKLSEIAKVVLMNEGGNGFRLERGEETYTFDSDAVRDISIESENTLPLPSKIAETTRVRLLIKSLNLIGNGQWSFKFGQKTISASIDDSSFLNNVHAGKSSYKSGDSLDVDLITETNYSSDHSPINTSYKIEKVYGIIQSVEQLKLQD